MPDPSPEIPPAPTPASSEPSRAVPPPAPPGPPAPPPSPPPQPVTDFNIAEEFGTAKRNLPPAKIVLISIFVIAIIVAIVAFHQRPKPQGAGSFSFVASAEVPNQHIVLAAVTFTLRNSADKSLWIRSMKAELDTADGKHYEDDAASAVDLDRYFQLFPPLKESSEAPISPETKLLPGTATKGTIVVSFPVTKQAFDQRKSLTVTIQPYDQPLPIVLR